MKNLISIPFFSVFFILVSLSLSFAQIRVPDIFEPKDDPLENILNAGNSDYQIRSGAFMGVGSGGAELSFYSEEKPIFGSLYFGVLANPENRIPDARQMRFGGFAIGMERPLYVANNESQIEVDSGVVQSGDAWLRTYYRLGAGVNFSVVERLDLRTGEQSSKLHPGIQTSGVFGVSTRVSRKFWMFMEMGGNLTWNQSLPQMRWWGRPYLSVGISTGSFW